MSNPARPPTHPLTLKQSELAEAGLSSAYFTPTDDFTAYVRTMYDPKMVLMRIRDLDFELARSIIIPKEVTCDARVLDNIKTPSTLAISNKKGLSLRKRSVLGLEMGNVMYSHLPQAPHRVVGFTQEEVHARTALVVSAGGGTEHTMGRIQAAYPRKGFTPSRPISQFEAGHALGACGLRLDRHNVPQRYPMFASESGEDQQMVYANNKADNGLPVGMKWGDLPAQQMVLRIAQGIYIELESAYRVDPVKGVWNWVRGAEAGSPHLVAFMGKAKEDSYKLSRVEARQLRFYNVVPRQILLIMQMATQPFEAQSRSLFKEGNSGQGISFMYGGAEDFVSELERRVEAHGYAYVHVGDDSLVVVQVKGAYVLFSLDASNFDLTQHGATTKAVHEVLRDELMLINPISAQLWYALARERLVVTFNAVTLKWKHGGASGLAMQSKVNDMLMEVMLHRMMTSTPPAWTHRDSVEALASMVGKAMGFAVRLEDHYVVPAASLRQALSIQPYLFIGYYIHVRDGMGMASFDVPRTLARIAYPNLGYEKDKRAFEVTEAIRLGSMTMNFGIPPAYLDAAFGAARQYAVELVARVLQKHGEVVDERLAWAVRDNPVASFTANSLSGLLAAMQRNPRDLWLKARTVGEPEPLTNWADIVDEDFASFGLVERLPPPAGRLPPAMRVRVDKPPTHPATTANVGRNPPTVRWAPDRPPRPVRDESGASTSRPQRRGTMSGFPPIEEENDSDYFGSVDDDFDLGTFMRDADDEHGSEELEDRYG